MRDISEKKSQRMPHQRSIPARASSITDVRRLAGCLRWELRTLMGAMAAPDREEGTHTQRMWKETNRDRERGGNAALTCKTDGGNPSTNERRCGQTGSTSWSSSKHLIPCPR